MKRFMTILLVLSLFKVGTAYAATPSTNNTNSGKILFGNSQNKSTGLNPVLALLVGPQGKIGPIGLQGPRGFTGLNGADGIPGAPGPAGPAGAAGPAGPAGPAGATGATGPAGANGTGSGGSASLGQGTLTVGACDNSITAAFTSNFASGTFSLETIILRDISSDCSGKTINVFFTMEAASAGSFGPYAVGNIIKCTDEIATIPSGTSATVTIARTDATCTNTTTSTSLGSDLRKIGARDFNSVVGLEMTDA